MKTNILSFLLGICIMLLSSATAQTTGLFEFKIAKPKQVSTYNGTSPEEYVIKMSKQGYVVATSANAGSSSVFVTMYKY